MDLKQWQAKPGWERYEATLLAKGWQPCWDEATEQSLKGLGITCCHCGRVPCYVGMTDGVTTLGFLACTSDCGEWFRFIAPDPASGNGE